MRVDVINSNGQATGRSVELPDAIFGLEPNEHVMYLAIKQYNAAQRQGTHKAKEKGEVWRTTKKFKKQKGTGGARAGSLKSPTVKGGGTIFGPRPRSYDIFLNKKVKKLAKYSALSLRAKQGKLKVVEDLTLDTPKTKTFVSLMKNIGVSDAKSTLFVSPELTNNVYLSGRNIVNARIINVSDINTFEVLKATDLVLFESAIAKIV